MAVASDGSLLANLTHLADLQTVDEVRELLRDGWFTGTVFIGIVLDPVRTKAALKRIDDAAAEVVATSTALVRRPRKRGQR